MTYLPSEVWKGKATSFFSVAFFLGFGFVSLLISGLGYSVFLSSFCTKALLQLCFLFPSAQLEVTPWWWMSHLCKLADSLYFKWCGGHQHAHPTSIWFYSDFLLLRLGQIQPFGPRKGLVVIISLKCQQSTSNQAFCNTCCELIRKEASSPILCGYLSSGIFIVIIVLVLKHSVGR